MILFAIFSILDGGWGLGAGGWGMGDWRITDKFQIQFMFSDSICQAYHRQSLIPQCVTIEEFAIDLVMNQNRGRTAALQHCEWNQFDAWNISLPEAC